MIPTMLAAFAIAVPIFGLAALAFRAGRRRRRPRLTAVAAVSFLIGLPPGLLGLYLAGRYVLGQPSADTMTLSDGISYRREVLTTPNLAVVHVVEIARPVQTQWAVSSAIDTPAGTRVVAKRATEAAVELRADLLINANFFTPFYDNFVLSSFPGEGDLVEPIGTVISDGKTYGRPKADWPSAWQREDGTIGFGPPPADARQAVTGRQWLVRDGQVAVTKDEPPYPRTVIAADGNRLWLIVVDGKQPRYSDGMTLGGLADYLVKLGATNAIELDGGGSAVLVRSTDLGPEVLSRPCHTKIPGRQRPTGVFLGIRLSVPITAN